MFNNTYCPISQFFASFIMLFFWVFRSISCHTQTGWLWSFYHLIYSKRLRWKHSVNTSQVAQGVPICTLRHFFNSSQTYGCLLPYRLTLIQSFICTQAHTLLPYSLLTLYSSFQLTGSESWAHTNRACTSWVTCHLIFDNHVTVRKMNISEKYKWTTFTKFNW